MATDPSSRRPPMPGPPMALLDIILRGAGELVVDFVRRELQAPNRWEADPKTKTIRRRRPRRESIRVEVKSQTSIPRGSQNDRDIIDVCPWCSQVMAKHTEAGKCPSD